MKLSDLPGVLIQDLKVGKLWRYRAVVMDKCTRKIVGWSYGHNKDVELTLRALNHAVRRRTPKPGLIFHTDRGIEYAAHRFRHRLAHLEPIQSMNRPGKVTDNAHVESFFHSMKTEVVHGRKFNEDREVKAVMRSYLPFYNGEKMHSSLNCVRPRRMRSSGPNNLVSTKSG